MSINELLEKYGDYLPVLISFIVAFLIANTTYWQLVILAGIIGGLSTTELKRGTLSCLIGVGFAWFLYVMIKILTTPVVTMFNQVAAAIMEMFLGMDSTGEGIGAIIIVVVVFIGCFFGALGGYLGINIRIVIDFLRKRSNSIDTEPKEVKAE